tara:strand:- start:5332 stop:8463 length:3132 start_codon:yes stop_codon:yes gene_type:complete
MANKKISAFTELTEAPATGDVLPIVDVSDTTGASTGTTKKVSLTNLSAGIVDISTSQLDAASLVTESEGIGSNDNDTTLPTSAAVKDYVDTQILTKDNLDEIAEGTTNKHFTASDETKLDGIESLATADQTDAEIRTAVGNATDSNVFTDADHDKLDGIESNATADQTDAEIRTAVGNATDSNVFTDADHSKLDGIATAATANDTDANLKDRANHTGTQAASTISDFDTEVANNSAVTANTAKVSNVTTNLSASADGTSLTVASSDGTDASIPAATTSAWGAMTDEDKSKLDGIESGAEVNVQSDWNASSGDAQILNKPTVPSALNDLSNVNASPTDGQVLKWVNASSEWQAGDDSGAAGGISEISEDTTPQLGGDLDVNGNEIITASGSNGDIVLSPDGTGKVGIGATPKRQISLHESAAASCKIQITNGTTGIANDGAGFQLGIGTDGTANIEQRENEDLVFHTNNNPRLTVKGDGHLQTQSAGSIGTASSAGSLSLWGGDTNHGGEINLHGGSSSDGIITFRTGAGEGQQSPKMTLTGTGLGIGTSSPSEKLHVYAGSSGATPQGWDGITLEDDTDCRINILTPDANAGFLIFGSASDNDHSYIAGYYDSGSPNLRFVTNGSEQVRILADGSVGIGTANPRTNLHVSVSAVAGYTVQNEGVLIERSGATAALNIATDNDQSGAIWFADGDAANSGQIIYNHSDNSLRLGTAATERMRIDSDGVVWARGGRLIIGEADVASGHIDSFENLTFNIDTDNDDTNRYFSFAYNASAGAGTEVLRINETGNVGIGTSSPSSSYKLDVRGNILAAGANANIQIDATSSYPYLNFKENGTNRVQQAYDITNDEFYVLASQAGSEMWFGTANTERMRITDDGTLDLKSEKLKLNGSGGSADQVLKTDGSGNVSWSGGPAEIGIACSDETSALSTGEKATVMVPKGMTIKEVKASLTEAGSSSSVVVNVMYHASNPNSATTSLFATSNALTIASGAYKANISTFTDGSGGTQSTYTAAEDSFLVVEIPSSYTPDSAARGLKVWVLGEWS